MSKIEDTIAEIEEYIDNCKFQPLSNSRIVVNRAEIDELIDELKRNVPEEIKKYQKIIANRDAILKDAQNKAEEMILKANEMTAQLVSEHEIMQQAYREANTIIEDATGQAGEIIDQATKEANDMKEASTRYLDAQLADIQKVLSTSINGLTVQCDDLVRSLESTLEITTRNREALDVPAETSAKTQTQPEVSQESDDTDEQ